MKPKFLVLAALAISSGCSCPHDYIASIHQQAQSGAELVKRCKGGDQAACDGAENILQTMTSTSVQ
jgi:hypothetical protein